MLATSFVLRLIGAASIATALECHPEGPIVPRPGNLTHSKPFLAALDNLTQTLDAAFSGEIKAGWDIRNVSISLGVVTLDQEEPAVPLWEYHHLASGNVNGTKSIDRNSQYLIGSVSKVISDAILLRSGINIDDPITKYIPSLNDSSSLIDWDSITLRALASQLSGIPPNYGFSEFYYLKDYFEQLGFPHLNDSAYTACGITGFSSGCTKEELLKGMLSIHPVAPPETRPVYSSIAFTLFIYALEAQTGKNYTELVHDISASLNLTSTFPSPGDDNLAVIPPVDNSWGSDYGVNAPGGGLVSTLADLSTFLVAILDRSALNSPAAVREWLQPRAFAGSAHSLVGAPWEIFRPPPHLLFPASSAAAQHTVTVYAKDGAAYGYHNRIAVVDEYGLGIVVLTAGAPNVAALVLDAALSAIVPAADAAAHAEAVERGYEATFVGESTAETGSVACNATAALGADGTVHIQGLYRDGSDVLEGLREVWAVTLSQFLLPLEKNGTWRVYPAQVETRDRYKGREVVREDWRIWFDVDADSGTELPGRALGEHNCMSWTLTDWIYYGSEPVDRVVFVKDAETGEVLGLDVPFLRTGVLERVKLL